MWFFKMVNKLCLMRLVFLCKKLLIGVLRTVLCHLKRL